MNLRLSDRFTPELLHNKLTIIIKIVLSSETGEKNKLTVLRLNTCQSLDEI